MWGYWHDHRAEAARHRRGGRPGLPADRGPGTHAAPVAGGGAHHHRGHRGRADPAGQGHRSPPHGGEGPPHLEAVQAGEPRLPPGEHGGVRQRRAGGGPAPGGYRRPVLGGEPRDAAQCGQGGAGRRRPPAPRRGFQAAHVPVCVPGVGGRGAPLSGRGQAGDGDARGHRVDGSPGNSVGPAVRRRDPGGGAQHAELPPAERAGDAEDPGAPEARDELDHPRAAHVRRVHHVGGQLQRHPVRAGDPDLRGCHAEHAGSVGCPGPEATDAPARGRGSEPRPWPPARTASWWKCIPNQRRPSPMAPRRSCPRGSTG